MSSNNTLNLRNTREITANSISILTDDNLIENIFDIFTRLRNIIKAKQTIDPYSGKVTHYFEPSDINDHNVPGLKSMIDYFETNYKLKHNTFVFEDNLSMIVKKNKTNKTNNFVNDDNSMTIIKKNKINKTNNFFNDDNSMTLIKKNYKQNVHHNILQNDTMTLNKVNKTQKVANVFNNIDNHTFSRSVRNKNEYHSINNHENHYFNKTHYSSNHHNAIYQFDNFTSSKQVKQFKQMPIYINQELNFWYVKK